MLVPDVITSESRDFNDSMSFITMNERDDNETIATATPTLFNPPKKRRRIMSSEPSLTDEEVNKRSKSSPSGGWNSKILIKESPSLAGVETSSITAPFGVPIAQLTDPESSQVSNHSSMEELSIELCKIVATDHYSRREAIETLQKFSKMAYTDDVMYLENFLELGGIQRVLIYLKNNLGDPACVAMASKVIISCTFRDPELKSFEIANEIVRVISKREGIQTLLDASSGYGGENMKSQLDALHWIWVALNHITNKASAYESDDEAALKDQVLNIFESGLEIMAKVTKHASPIIHAVPDSPKGYNSGQMVLYNTMGGADEQLNTVRGFLTRLCGGNGSRKRAAMDMSMTRYKQPAMKSSKAATASRRVDNSKEASYIMQMIFAAWLDIVHHSKLTRDDTLGLDLLQKCVTFLKTSGTQEWIPNKELVIQASRFFVQCQVEGILSTSEDFEVVFPLVVECVSKYPDASYHAELFGFISDASKILEEKFLKESGVFRAVSMAWEMRDVEEDTKKAAHDLLGVLLNLSK